MRPLQIAGSVTVDRKWFCLLWRKFTENYHMQPLLVAEDYEIDDWLQESYLGRAGCYETFHFFSFILPETKMQIMEEERGCALRLFMVSVEDIWFYDIQFWSIRTTAEAYGKRFKYPQLDYRISLFGRMGFSSMALLWFSDLWLSIINL